MPTVLSIAITTTVLLSSPLAFAISTGIMVFVVTLLVGVDVCLSDFIVDSPSP